MRIFFKRLRHSLAKALARRALTKGFTLVEMLVVALIVILITSFILFRQQGFNSSTLLRSLSYSVALSVRQAQVYGVAVKGVASTGGATNFAYGYGVHIVISGGATSPITSYLLFADLNNNTFVDTGETTNTYTIGNGRGTDYYISKFCAHVANGADQCTYGTSPTINVINIYFRRPQPDACFVTDQNLTNCLQGATPFYSYAYIQMRSAGSSDTRTIKVTQTGQIAVCQLNADPAAC